MAHTLLEDIKNHLPPYLTPQQKDDLLEQIKKFPKINYYIHKADQDMLQGDGWSGFTVMDFVTCEKKQVKGIIFSNSCDIDNQNKRTISVNIVFVPLIRLNKYIELLTSSSLSQDKISSKLEAIKQQKVTSIMYFPKGGDLDEDYIANFDDVHSQPLQSFLLEKKTKLFTLSQAGFYLFLLKLSIHFCRFQEGVLRY